MAVPFRRTSKTRKRTRRSHHALKNLSSNVCSVCGSPVLPHRACTKCGNYKQRQALKVENA
jgi:large subunit ribosomal protein L32